MQCCTNVQIYNLLNLQTGTVIVDCRSVSDYEKYRLKYPMLVHIPEGAFGESLKSVATLCTHHTPKDPNALEIDQKEAADLLIKIENHLFDYERCVFRDRLNAEVVVVCEDGLSDHAGLLSALLLNEGKCLSVNHLELGFPCFSEKFKFMIDTRSVLCSVVKPAQEPAPVEFDRLFISKQKSQLIRQYPNCVLEDWLFIGSRKQACNRDMITEMGITHIVRFHDTREDEIVHEQDVYERIKEIKYLDVAVDDNLSAEIEMFLEPCMAFYDNAVQNKNAKVFVHCNMGISRSTTFVLCVLMKKNKMTLLDSLTYTRKCRRIAQPNYTFMKALIKYEHDLFGRNTVTQSDLQTMNVHYRHAHALKTAEKAKCVVM